MRISDWSSDVCSSDLCTIPACVPSRTSMLTGRWPQATRVRMNLDPQDAFFSQDVYQVAHDQGYRTALCGKNHTYKTAQGVDFWREYGTNKASKAPGASADVAPHGRATWREKVCQDGVVA